MKKIDYYALGALLLLGIALMGPPSYSQNAEVKSLRGDTPVTENAPPADITDQDVGKRFVKNYRQQPPLIPHKIDKYEIDQKVNQCLRCHDWPRNVTENAPKISETHYVDRNGAALDHVSRRRWFCTQCHVPQSDTEPLVKNGFVPLAPAQ